VYPSLSDSTGGIKFEARHLYGNRKLILQTVDSTLQLTLNNPLSKDFSLNAIRPFSLNRSMEMALTDRSIALQVQDIYYEKYRTRYKQPMVDTVAFFGKPDETYYLDQYTRFPVMEEVMREYVPGVLVRKRKDGFHFLVLNRLTRGILKDSPLILLDGVPLYDADAIMDFDPRKIKKLEVVTRPYYLGNVSFDGIVSYTTYAGDLAGFEIRPTALTLDYEGMQLQREFFSPKYETEVSRNSRMPDQRFVLFWKGDLTVTGEHNVEFYTSDVEGEFMIRAEGITENGFSGTAWASFDVRHVDN
jgi:hypothetical protein